MKIKGIDGTKERISVLALDSRKNIIAAGYGIGPELIKYADVKSFVYTKDEKNNWRKSVIGIGEVSQIVSHGTDLFAINVIKRNRVNIDESVIYKSNDGGKEWQEIAKFRFLVSDLSFSIDSEGFLIAHIKKGEWAIFRTIDRGLTWNVIHMEQNESIVVPLNISGECKYFAFNVDSISLISFKNSKPNKFYVKVNLNRHYKFLDVVASDSSVIIVGHINGLDTINFIDLKNDYTFLENYSIESTFIPDKINFHEGVFSMLVSKAAGFGLRSKILVSRDFGRSWKKFIEPQVIGNSPFYFRDNIYYIYIGDGIIQVISIK